MPKLLTTEEKRKAEIRRLTKRLNELRGDEHEEAIAKYGHCRLPGCVCTRRLTFSRHRVGKEVKPAKEPTQREWTEMIKQSKKKERSIEKRQREGCAPRKKK